MPEYGIILLNLGGPDSIKNVEKFLYNLFSDPDIFKFPLSPMTQKFFAKLISKLRAKKVVKYYKQIGGRSPILSYTLVQAKLLEKKLEPTLDCKIYIGMRYWRPFIDEALERALKDNVQKIVLLPLYPQYSTTTTGSSFNEFYRALKKLNMNEKKIIKIRSYPDDEIYVKAMAERIEEAMENFNDEDFKSFSMIFSAHSLPVKFIRNGDPYLEETKKSYNAIINYLRNNSKRKEIYKNIKTELSFQSKVGPIKWLEPSTIDMIKKLANEGIKNILVVPLSFVSDNIETLYELGIFVRDIAIKNGVEKYMVAEALNDSETFSEALKNIVLEAIKNEK
ncbi:ferrochelatase [Candidatus Kryptobacter tengchongensis]|nr:ferrochelatase [Candidatus Kryptobacter tengchongensis]